VNVHIETRTLNLRHTFTIARGSSDEKHNVFLRIEKDGFIGWGEAAPNIRYSETPESATEAIGKLCEILPDDLSCYTPLLQSMNDSIPGEYAAKAAVDMAVMDWVSQSYGIPLYKMWGLNPMSMPKTSMTIAIDTPAEMAKRALEAQQYEILKIKLGTADDRAIIEAIRSVSDQAVRVDANEGWLDRETAISEIEWLAEKNVEIIEQPMPASQLEDMAWLKKRSPLPLIADEAFTTIKSLFDLKESYHGINIKLMKCGGTQAARDAVILARALDMSVMLGCMVESSVGIAAAAHIAPMVDYADLDGNLLISNDPFNGHPVVNGAVLLNSQPGLGVSMRA